MLASPFIFNPILWVILLTITFFGNIYLKVVPQDQEVIIPAAMYYSPIWENGIETKDWDYDNVDDDIFALKKHYKIGTDVYVFQATGADVPANQWQDVVFTDEKGNRQKYYLYFNSVHFDSRADFETPENIYEHTYICKTEHPHKNGYWELSANKNDWCLYLPLEKRSKPEVEVTLLFTSMYSIFRGSTSFIYYVPDQDGVPKAVDKITLEYESTPEAFKVVSETHGFD